MGIRRADEMEMSINLRATRLAWSCSAVALLVYCICELAMTGKLPTVPFMILIGQLLVFFVVKIVLSKVLAKGTDNEE